MSEHYSYDTRIQIVQGGKTRQDSVYNGLQVVNQDYVMIHDGARPLLKKVDFRFKTYFRNGIGLFIDGT